MPRSLTTIVDSVLTPWGTLVPESGTTVYLSDLEFALVTPSSIGVAWTDNGQVSDVGDEVSVQANNVAAVGALTVSAVGTQTAVNPAALTATAIAASNAAAQTGSYVQADVQTIATLANELKTDYTALLADVTAIRTQVIALVTDVTEIFAKFDAGVTDIGTLRTAINDILTELTGTGKPMSA